MSVFRVSLFHGRGAKIFEHEFADVEDAKGALARLVGRMILQDPELAWMPGGFAIHLADDAGRAVLSLNLNGTIAPPVAWSGKPCVAYPPPVAANMR